MPLREDEIDEVKAIVKAIVKEELAAYKEAAPKVVYVEAEKPAAPAKKGAK